MTMMMTVTLDCVACAESVQYFPVTAYCLMYDI